MSLRSHEAAACAVIAIGVCGVLVGSLLVESMRNGQSSAKATVSTAQSTEEVQAQTEPTQTPAPPPAPEPVVQTVHISATGDNLLHEGIYNQARARGSDGHYDFIPAYENLRDFYAGFDVNWLNQETLVNDDYEPSGYPMFSTPGDITNALYNVGFRVFSLSNNHSYDKGAGGIASSMAHWAAMPDDVVSMGFYNLETYDDYVYQTVNGVTIGYLSYTEMTNGLPTPSGSEYGVVYLDQRDVIEKQITDMRPNCDVLVVSCHWGVEGSHTVTDAQRETAQWLADQGADLIIGTHPHVTQTAQWLTGTNENKSFVAYSLGNFINAQDMPDNMIGAILDVTFQKTTAADGTVTVEIQNPVLHPVITQYEPHYANIRVYLYKDYTDELGAAHGNFALSRASIEQVLNGSIDSEFLSLE